MTSREGPDRVLVIGLDGASFGLIRPWLQNGDLPCLSRLYREGLRGNLASVVPPLSPEAWSTFMTGKHPGKHGVMNFLGLRPDSYEVCFNSGASLRERTLWRLLSDAGRRVGVIGVPMTYPPETVNGYVVSGLETPGAKSQFTYPAALAEELHRALGGYDLHGDFVERTTPEMYLARVLENVDNQAKAACYLFEHYPADFSMLVLGGTDRAQHCFWKFSDPKHPGYADCCSSELSQALWQVYQHVDAAVAKVLASVPDPKTVVIMSDHGFEPCHKLVHLNCWLEYHGYLTRLSGGSTKFDLTRRAWQSAAKYAPQWLKDWLKGALPSFRQHVQSFLLLSRTDWSRTRAFSLSMQHGYIYLNRKGRFPQGIVDPGQETDDLCRELTEKLMGFTDPDTKQPIVEAVHRVKDLHPGPANEYLPDLVVLWKQGYIARTEAKDERPGRDARDFIDADLRVGDLGRLISIDQSGAHAPEGILIAHGPNLAPAGEVHGAAIIDLAPTLLHLLGEPVPDDMGGRVLEELLSPEFRAAHPIRQTEGAPLAPVAESPYSEEEAQQVEQRLRDLGYMD
jgi:predicted AlkP superfamily phosphohydrolase/phosphomutase